jgi:glycosyltransferase involved in cell wall biosynthesis
MSSKKHILVIDPTAFAGGSKVATENILRLLDTDNIHITVVTTDRSSWQWHKIRRIKMFEPAWLSKQQQGIPFFIRHILIAIKLLMVRLRYGKFDIALGASGPGVDLSLYLLRLLMNFRLIQLVHGPVARSRTIGRCLNVADEVHYLDSTEASLRNALSTIDVAPTLPMPSRFQIMVNGLSAHNWPEPAQHERPVLFWAASLLRWKGLDTLLEALKKLDDDHRPETQICYIRPEDTQLAISEAPVNIKQVQWHEKPEHLDQLRAKSSIFVSTSKKEPFGLSILEAMASGHCVMIPADGAYWDQILDDGINCIKYTPDDSTDLAGKIMALSQDMAHVKKLGLAAMSIADSYRAEVCYSTIKKALDGKSASTEDIAFAMKNSELTS